MCLSLSLLTDSWNNFVLFNSRRTVKQWRVDLGKSNKKAADSLADPSEYENLFPEFQEALQAEKVPVHVARLELQGTCTRS